MLTPLPSTIKAAILIWALQILKKLSRTPHSALEVCKEYGVSSSQAATMVQRLQEAASCLHKASGRPSAAFRAKASRDDIVALFEATRDFLMDTPGAVERRGSRRIYQESFRRFVLEQMEAGRPGSSLGITIIATTVGVPLGTLKNWISYRKLPAVTPNEPEDPEGPTIVTQASSEPTIEFSDPCLSLVLQEYSRWNGTFTGFCAHLTEHHRIPFGITFIGTVLELAGMRQPRRRKGKESSRPWSRGTYEKLFPGAQWVGDGKSLAIWWKGQPMVFNLEAIIDPASGGLVGVEITDSEDEQSVISAFEHAKRTTDQNPLALTLDNRESNHTTRIEEAIIPTQLLASTPGRPTSKAPIEGAFGLFSQTAPPLAINGFTERESAREVLKLLVLLWAWNRNHKPRAILGNRTPAQVYQQDSPTPDEVAHAKETILRLKKKQNEMRRTREERSDPVRRQILVENLDHLNIENSDRLATWLSSYSLEGILRGLAVFRAKREQKTLPANLDDGRYLGGIIKNIHAKLEDELMAKHLIDLRLRAGEIGLEFLARQRDDIRKNSPNWALPQRFLEQSLQAQSLLDYRFWRDLALEVLQSLPVRIARAVYQNLVRMITRAFKTTRDRRQDLVATLSTFETVAVQ